MAETTNVHGADDHGDGQTRRDFLILTTAALGVIGVGGVAWPFIDSMNPAADALALATIEVDIKAVAVGQSITALWRGKPVFIRHRTAEEIEAAEKVALTDLKDPEADEARVKKKEWLIVTGVCTHLGCVPSGQKPADMRGEYNGWFCPCHGSQYDTSGRIRKGPAPRNLDVPTYAFLSDTLIKIG